MLFMVARKDIDLDKMLLQGASEEEIMKRARALIAERDDAKKKIRINTARTKMNAALQEYLIALGVDEDTVDSSTFDTILQSFESEIQPALKVFAAVPKKKESRSTLDDDALEAALGALRSFADSL